MDQSENNTEKLLDRLFDHASRALDKVSDLSDMDDLSFTDENEDLLDESIEELKQMAEELASEDARYEVTVSKDHMSAFLKVFPHKGMGERPSYDNCRRAIKQAGITYGIDEDLIFGLLELYKDKNEITEVKIACGQEVIDGRDAVHKLLFKSDKNNDINDKAKVDHRERNLFVSTMSGQKLVKRYPPEAGQDGVTVYGKVLKASSGKDSIIKAGPGTEWNDSNTEMTACIDGEVIYSKKEIQVKPHLRISGDVDMKIGNLFFQGSVHIEGSILDEFIVQATENITVLGSVYAAKVISGGDIVVRKGFIGRSKGLIRSAGNFEADFVENGIIEAGGNITIHSQIMHSNIKTAGKIEVIGGKGSIMGGHICATKGVEVRTIGSELGIATSITTGKDFAILKKIDELDKNEAYIRKTYVSLKDILQSLMNKGVDLNTLSGQKKKVFKDLTSKIKVLKEKLEKISEDKLEARKMIIMEVESSISVIEHIFPGTRINIGGSNLDVKVRISHSLLTEDRSQRIIDINPL